MRTHCFLATQMRGQQQLTTSYMHRFQIEPAKLANLYVCPCTQMDFLIVVQFLTTLTKHMRILLSIVWFKVSFLPVFSEIEYYPVIPQLVLFNRTVCLFIENLHLAEHSKTLSDIQGRVPQFPRKIHLCLLKYYLSKLLIQTNALFHCSSNQILLHNMQLIIFCWIFVFYISYSFVTK